MKIISKYHDYYDSVRVFGADPNIVYVRKKQVFSKDDPKTMAFLNNKAIQRVIKTSPLRGHYAPYDLQLEDIFLLPFCGKFYICVWLLKHKEGHHNCYFEEKHQAFCYNFDSVYGFVLARGHKTVVREWAGPGKKKKNKNKWSWNSYSKFPTPERFKTLFAARPPENHPDILEIHHQFETPCMIYSIKNQTLSLNPVLSEIMFARALNPYTCFQEISMFISGILGGRSPKMVDISDQDRIAMHGFDKWSFRKESTKRMAS